MFKFLCSNVGLKLWLKIIQWIAEWCNSFEYFHCPVVKTLDPFSFQFCGWNLAKNVNIVELSLNNRDQGASPVIKRLNTGIITKSGVGILNTDDNSIHVYTKIVNEIWWNYSQKLIIWGGNKFADALQRNGSCLFQNGQQFFGWNLTTFTSWPYRNPVGRWNIGVDRFLGDNFF